MTRFLISFDDGWMTFPEEDLPDAGKAALAVVHEAQEAGVWVYGAGLESQRASIVSTDGTITDGPYPETKEVIGGFAVVDVPSREEALEWQPRSPSPAAARKRCGRSCPTRRSSSKARHRRGRRIEPEPAQRALIHPDGAMPSFRRRLGIGWSGPRDPEREAG